MNNGFTHGKLISTQIFGMSKRTQATEYKDHEKLFSDRNGFTHGKCCQELIEFPGNTIFGHLAISGTEKFQSSYCSVTYLFIWAFKKMEVKFRICFAMLCR